MAKEQTAVDKTETEVPEEAEETPKEVPEETEEKKE